MKKQNIFRLIVAASFILMALKFFLDSDYVFFAVTGVVGLIFLIYAIINERDSN